MAKNIKEIIKNTDYGVDEAGLIAEEIVSLIKDRIKEIELSKDDMDDYTWNCGGKEGHEVRVQELKRLLGIDDD